MTAVIDNMNKLKTFFNTFYKSLTSPKYYLDILQAKFSFSLKYFLMLAFLSSAISVGLLSIKILPEAKTAINAFNVTILKSYPADLVITAKDGQLSSNKTEPIMVPIPLEVPSGFKDTKSQLKNILVFDPNGTVDDLKKYETAILVNKSNVIMQGENDQIRIQPLKDIPNGTFTYADFTTALGKLEKLLSFAPYFFGIFLLIAFFIAFTVLGLIISFFLSLIFWLFAKITHLNISLAKAYQLSLHIFTLYAILDVADQVFSRRFPYGINFIVAMIYGLLIINKMRKTSTAPVVSDAN